MKTIPLIALSRTTTLGAVPPRLHTLAPAVNVAIVYRGKAQDLFSVVDRVFVMNGPHPAETFVACTLGTRVNLHETRSCRSDLRLMKGTTQWS